MKRATVSELRNEFGRLSNWLARGETIEILPHGRPVADLVPKVEIKSKALLGATPCPCPLPLDIDEPVAAYKRPAV